MKSIKRVAALVMALLFVGCGVLSNVGTISQVEAAAKISVKKKTLNQGQKLTLKVTGAKGAIKWSVSNDNVKLNKKSGKTVKVTAVKAGTSKVTAKAKGKKLTCTIKVNGLNIVNKELTVGQSFKLKATGLGKKIKWSVSNKNVAIKVSKKVNVTATAKAEGNAVITAKVGKKSYKCTVVVKHVHKTVKIAGKAATCAEPGLTDGQKCSVCGVIVVAQKVIPVLAHKTIHFDAIEPACHYNGRVEYWFCPDCEGFWTDAACTRVTNSKSVILPATGSENVEHVAAKEPTATENGNVEYWFCPDCEQFWLDQAYTRLTNALSVILPATGEPEVPEEGSEYNPIPLIPTETETGIEASVTVPAGATVWYQGRVANMNLLAYAAGEDAFSIIYNGESSESYSDWDGGQVLEISSLIGRPMVSFAIVNTSEVGKTFTLTFSHPVGTRMNPDELWISSSLAILGEGNSEGYYFSHIAESEGVLDLAIQSIESEATDAAAELIVTNNNTGAQLTMSDNGVDGVLSVPVSAGDQLIVQVVMIPNSEYVYPAAYVMIGAPAGTEENPIMVNESSVDVSVAAGETVYFNTRATGNLVITCGNAVVMIDGEEYTPVDGVVSVPVAGGMWAPPVSITITNASEEAIDCKVEIVIPTGTWENPEVVEAGTHTLDVAEGSQVYIYTYIAEEDGTLEIEVSSTTGWTYTVNNITTVKYGDKQWSGDAEASNVYTVEVSAGDEIQIIVNTADSTDENLAAPAGTITMEIGYASDSNMDVEEDTDDGYGEIF